MTLNMTELNFIAELHEAYKTDTLQNFIERHIGRDPFRYYIDTENRTYRGFNALLDRFVVIVDQHGAELIKDFFGEHICYLPEGIRRALYAIGRDSFDLEAIDPEDLIEC